MRVDRILYPITTLGPGRRVAVWTAGCSKRCEKCENPELWNSSPEQEIDSGKLAKILVRIRKTYNADGVTITGGDPVEQLGCLVELLGGIRPYYDDILVYTGYTLEEMEAEFESRDIERLRELVDVVIDGRYNDAANDGISALRGSSNQHIVFFSDSVKDRYEDYIARGRAVQNVSYNGRVVSVGIHNRSRVEELANG